MNPLTVEVFVNSKAGSYSRARTVALCFALEAQGARVLVTESELGDLFVDERADRVCSVGGDGTLRHVVAAVQRSGRAIPIGIYPAGTVNLLAMEYASSSDPNVLASRLLGDGDLQRHYSAIVGNTPILACASVGPDSHAVDLLSPGLKRRLGRAAYLVAFCRVLWRWQRTKIILMHGDSRIECGAVYIAKGRFFAGRWSFAPEARGSDPRLHVVALSNVSRVRFLLFAWAMLRHRDLNELADVSCFACTDLAIIGDGRAPLQADGDIVARLPVRISIAPEILHFT